MKVRVIKNVLINNEHGLNAEFVVNKDEAERLVKLGYAEEVVEDEKPTPAPKRNTAKK